MAYSLSSPEKGGSLLEGGGLFEKGGLNRGFTVCTGCGTPKSGLRD